MLTINYNWKTYKITGDNSEIEWVIRTAINNWVLEEVKENKEPQYYTWDIDIITGKPFKSGSTAQVYSTV